VLLNGFKRYRCARKLGIGAVRIARWAGRGGGIIQLLRTANDHALGILEQAAFLDELKSARNLSVAKSRRNCRGARHG